MNSIENIECDPTGSILIKNEPEQENGTTKISGIYKIINKINNKYYVGSSKNISKRFKEHKTYLKGHYHFNSHLQYSWNKYGENNFEFILIEHVLPDQLLTTEQKYLNISNKSNSYNASFIAGRPEMSLETRLKISNSHKGKIASEETRQKLREKWIGRIITNETKEKIRLSKLGNKNPNYNKSPNIEIRQTT